MRHQAQDAAGGITESGDVPCRPVGVRGPAFVDRIPVAIGRRPIAVAERDLTAASPIVQDLPAADDDAPFGVGDRQVDLVDPLQEHISGGSRTIRSEQDSTSMGLRYSIQTTMVHRQEPQGLGAPFGLSRSAMIAM